MPEFMPGLKLCQHFFEEAIQPLMAEHFPRLNYSTARLDYGSDTLGFDTPMSMDHGWGPKMTLYLSPSDYATMHQELNDFFAHHLPFEIRGFPVHFGEPYADGGKMQAKSTYPIHHMITLTTPEMFFAETLGVDIHQDMSPNTWLTLPQQRLLTVRKGQIYHDGLNRLFTLQKRFNWYPHDLWLYLMACQWQRIDQEEPFMGRTGSVGDVLGSRLIAARLIRDIMLLAFLIEKQYAPYSKWFGSAFQQLSLAESLTPLITSALNSEDWQAREKTFSRIYLLMAEAHNTLGITEPITPEVSNFHGRPFLVLHSNRFVQPIFTRITDPAIRNLPHIGSVNQVVDNTDVLEDSQLCQKIGEIYHTIK